MDAVQEKNTTSVIGFRPSAEVLETIQQKQKEFQEKYNLKISIAKAIELLFLELKELQKTTT